MNFGQAPPNLKGANQVFVFVSLRRLFPHALGALIALLPVAAALPRAEARLSDDLVSALENALNSNNSAGLSGLLEKGPGLNPTGLESRLQLLRQTFSDARWQLNSGPDLKDGRSTLLVKVTGNHQEAGRTFRLEASQKLAVQQNGNRLSSQEILGEESILRSGKANLAVSVIAPEEVLTGQRYDFDVVLDQPLKDSVLAGGISELSREAIASLRSPDISLGALNGGGIFKTIQAPYKPGSQSWAVLLMHPEGTVSVSRMVRVVARR
ncbi:hypothetical protein [Synechococcus sp. UW140]|uniref:hypothetical protein n=1 Tax=Synechococcus sp. UW140 TaxID=368503 RepID=UPI00313838B0